MKKQKRIWISLLLSIILIVVLSGCSGLPKTAKINISFSPNPVPYTSETGRWSFNVIFSESDGVGVTLISLRFDAYDQEEQLVNTTIWYEEDITKWFDSNYLPAFSALSGWVYYTWPHKYVILTVAGVDDNNNPIEATERLDFLPK
jgi:hypothetical protein